MTATGAELPNRAIQRELVFQKVKDPIAKGILRNLVPQNRRLELTERSPFREKLFEILKREGADTYRHLFGIATTTENPLELSNIFQEFAYLTQPMGTDRNSPAEENLLGKAQEEFLTSTVAPLAASDGARALQGEMIAVWNTKSYEPIYKRIDAVGALVFATGHLSDFSLVGEPGRRIPFLTEAYLLSVLDPQTPLELRQALLTYSYKMFDMPMGAEDVRFRKGVSFWNTVDGAWIYPDLLGESQENFDSRDWEIMGLRKQVESLQRELEERQNQPSVDPSLGEEVRRLRDLADRMEEALQDTEEKLEIYKELGQHPLDALGLGYGVWRNATPDQRRETVLKAYREKAKRYHYQTPRSDPAFDEVHQELANKEFSRLTHAYDYLNKHTDQDEF